MSDGKGAEGHFFDSWQVAGPGSHTQAKLSRQELVGLESWEWCHPGGNTRGQTSRAMGEGASWCGGLSVRLEDSGVRGCRLGDGSRSVVSVRACSGQGDEHLRL
jgi:hypothetical protein